MPVHPFATQWFDPLRPLKLSQSHNPPTVGRKDSGALHDIPFTPEVNTGDTWQTAFQYQVPKGREIYKVTDKDKPTQKAHIYHYSSGDSPHYWMLNFSSNHKNKHAPAPNPSPCIHGAGLVFSCSILFSWTQFIRTTCSDWSQTAGHSTRPSLMAPDSLSLSSLSLMKPGWRLSLSRKLWVSCKARSKQTFSCACRPHSAGGHVFWGGLVVVAGQEVIWLKNIFCKCPRMAFMGIVSSVDVLHTGLVCLPKLWGFTEVKGCHAHSALRD